MTTKTITKICLLAAIGLASAVFTSCKDKEPTKSTVAVESITMRQTLSIVAGESQTLAATVMPDDATDKTVTWTSSNESIATVDAAGKVTAIAVGTTTIGAKAGDKTATCEVTVVAEAIPVTSISIPQTLSLNVGEFETITATVLPANATDSDVTWTSSNKNVATVNAAGKITAIAEGTTTIVAKAGGKTAACEVTVNEVTTSNIPVASVSIPQTLSLSVGGFETITATVLPANATNKNITWTSSNESVATVDVSGKITAIAAGSAIITASATNGKNAACTVSVTASTEPIEVPGGVKIGNTIWATCNVDEFGTFADNPQDVGKFYQWNRPIAWAATGSVSGWDSSDPVGTEWEAANDPCPTGWRVPTEAELKSLGNGTWTSDYNSTGVVGRIFGTAPNQVFFPAAGYRDNAYDGMLIGYNRGYYWSSTKWISNVGNTVYILYFDNTTAFVPNSNRVDGQTVRCVKK